MEIKGLNILVVDDKQINLDAAVAQLKEGNDVKVLSNFDEAMRLLKGERDDSFELKPHGFDMVLVDLLMPAGEHCMGSKGMSYVGVEMPIGIFLALVAAKNGARYVGILSDMNHHDHPASACLDNLADIISVNKAKFVASNAGSYSFRNEDLLNLVDYWDAREENKRLKEGFVSAKDWRPLAKCLVLE